MLGKRDIKRSWTSVGRGSEMRVEGPGAAKLNCLEWQSEHLYNRQMFRDSSQKIGMYLYLMCAIY